MQPKKILIVSRSFYPENRPRAFRTTELAIEYARLGHEVTVLIPKNEHHTLFEQKHNLKIIDLGKITWPVFSSNNRILSLVGKVLMRILLWLLEYPNLQLSFQVARALRNMSGYDLLISIAHPYPIHWGVALAWKKHNRIAKHWIADCGDPYMGRVNSDLRPPFYFKFIEKWFMRKPDYITVPTEGSLKGYYKEFHPKIRIIPQGFNFDDIVLSNELQKATGKIVFGYAGGFIPKKRDPTEFLEYLNSLSDDIDYEFHLYVKNAPYILPFVQASNGRIKIKETLPRPLLLKELSRMNFLVNFENLGNVETPSKLIDYAFLQKPVLSIVHKSLNTKLVDDFLSGDYSLKRALPNIDDYRVEKIAKNFLSLIYPE